MIRLDQCSVRRGAATLLQDVQLELERGAIAIVGPNGAGKSTLLHLCADGGRSRPHCRVDGRVTLEGEAIRQLAPERLARRRAFLPQQHAETLPLPVRRILELAGWPHGTATLPAELLHDAVARWELDALLERAYDGLSGGERQRAQLARTWLQLQLQQEAAARLWLLDEPQGALDLPHQQALLRQLAAEAAGGALVLFSTHDLNFALRAAGRILVLKAGRLVADTTPDGLADPVLLRHVFNVDFHLLRHRVDGLPLLVPA